MKTINRIKTMLTTIGLWAVLALPAGAIDLQHRSFLGSGAAVTNLYLNAYGPASWTSNYNSFRLIDTNVNTAGITYLNGISFQGKDGIQRYPLSSTNYSPGTGMVSSAGWALPQTLVTNLNVLNGYPFKPVRLECDANGQPLPFNCTIRVVGTNANLTGAITVVLQGCDDDTLPAYQLNLACATNFFQFVVNMNGTAGSTVITNVTYGRTITITAGGGTATNVGAIFIPGERDWSNVKWVQPFILNVATNTGGCAMVTRFGIDQWIP